MWIFFFIQLALILIFILLGWMIVKKEAYGLISNFRGRPKEEQEELIQRGYPQKAGKLLIITGVALLCLLPLLFTGISFVLEISVMVMMFFLLGGFIYLSKYEVPRKQKLSYIISSSIAVTTFVFLGIVFFFGYQDFELKAQEESFEITGVYGDEWSYEEVQEVRLLSEMPEVTARTNGYGMPTLSKGHFKLKEYGKGLLFVYRDSSPYLFIQTKEETIIINSKSADNTESWYDFLKEHVSKEKE
ncbi:hypothetical protein FIU87_06010 [Bacillus sp. THAF10]|uniref:DUF3784 domain-containing protein n=1 Tax=Bacillus sp. THAF10 TaxID=2587848 RepID=UPI0012689AB5|nr:DUF3784 domain-containing protein [Bacillus sp. THAF10]QFT88188.1 hypothetical protein FIU87_06010 [Bacillus sp. THAF10]